MGVFQKLHFARDGVARDIRLVPAGEADMPVTQTQPQVGAPAPDFQLIDQNGLSFNLASFRGEAGAAAVASFRGGAGAAAGWARTPNFRFLHQHA